MKSRCHCRFRLISNVVMNCPLQVYIESHPLLAISSDGGDFEAVDIDTVIASSGERYAIACLGNFCMLELSVESCVLTI